MRYKEFAESDDDLFAPRPGAPRIAEYINRLADHSDFLDPEEVPVVKAVSRAFRRDMRSGLEAFEAMEPTLNNHIYGMVAKNMGIDLYDEAEKVGIDLTESDDMFAERPSTRIADYIEGLAQRIDYPEEVPVVKAVARAFRRDMRSGLLAWDGLEDPDLNGYIQDMVEQYLDIDLLDEWERIGLDESDNMFAPRQAQRIAQYLHSTAHQGDDPELTKTIQGLARAFGQGMQPGLAALKAVDDRELQLHLLDELDDELNIDLEDDYAKVGILETDDLFGQRAKPVLAPTPMGKICADLAQEAYGWAEEARAKGNTEDADWCMEQYQEYIEVAQAFQKSWEQGLARWNQTQDPPRNQLRRAVQSELNTDLVQAWLDVRSKVKESDDMFAWSRHRPAPKPIRPPQPKLSAPVIDRQIMGYIPVNSVVFDGIDWDDPTDLANVYVEKAAFADGTPLNDAQLERLTDELDRTGQLLEMVGEIWRDWAENWAEV